MGDKNNKETDEKPKAVIEMEENSDKGKAKRRLQEKRNLSIKDANKKFFIKFGIFTAGLAIVTGGTIFFTIKSLNPEKKEESTIFEETVEKVTAKDSKYAINSFSETYNDNSIKIDYCDIDGNKEASIGNSVYIQISGLLNKNVQETINKRLKQTAINLKGNSRYVYSNVTANFGNILSVSIYADKKTEYINVDLNTGKDIKFEEVFVSSAPINSLITEGVFKALAWDKLDSNYEKFGGILDMDKVDASNYEDIALMVVNNYKKIKQENIKFQITPSYVSVIGLIDPSFTENSQYERKIEIDFTQHKDEIAIYKRFLSDNSIYESDSVGDKGIIVFTENFAFYSGYTNLLYEKVQDNVFMEEALIDCIDEDDENAKPNIEKYLKYLAEEDKKNLISQIQDTTGAIYQKEYYMTNFDTYYKVEVHASKATCDISYYKENAFKDYIEMKSAIELELALYRFSEYNRKQYPYLAISEEEEINLFFDKEGNFIGNDENEAKSKTNSKSNIPEETPESNETMVKINTNMNNTNINNNSISNNTNSTNETNTQKENSTN